MARARERARSAYDQPHITEDVTGQRERYMDALKIQQIDHLERGLQYRRRSVDLGIGWRA
jgi:hypothetical protein